MLIAGYFSVGALVWCWESAYNVLQGDDPAYGFSLFLVLLGLLPVVAGGIYFCAMRRRGTAVRGGSQPRLSAPLRCRLAVACRGQP